MNKPIRVLVVDDSATMRDLISGLLAADPGIEVIGTAEDPYIAREMIKKLSPDVLTLDIEMPHMDGLSFLEKIMTLRPMPVVMVSTLTLKGAEETLEALEIGAVDCVAKPMGVIASNTLAHLQHELITKVKNAAAARLPTHRKRDNARVVAPPEYRPSSLIAIGASTGGVEALRALLTALPARTPPIVITQHMPPGFTRSFAERLRKLCAIGAHEAEDGMEIAPNTAYIAPGGYHLAVTRKGGVLRCRVYDGETVSGHKPSVDVLLRSIAETVGDRATGAILTGMGRDGANGLLAMRQAGSATFGQSEESCVIYGMPKAAREIGAVKEELPLQDMARRLLHACAA